MLEDKKGMLSGKKAVGIILLVVGAMLLFFIISQGMAVYKESRKASDSKGLSSVQCVGYLYEISDISATGDEVQFRFENLPASSADVRNLTVTGASSIPQNFDVSIPVGSSLAVRVPVVVENNFTVHPADCPVFPANCNVEGECTYK